MYLVKSWKSKSKSKSDYLELQIYDVRHSLQVIMHCITALLKYLLICRRLGVCPALLCLSDVGLSQVVM